MVVTLGVVVTTVVVGSDIGIVTLESDAVLVEDPALMLVALNVVSTVVVGVAVVVG